MLEDVKKKKKKNFSFFYVKIYLLDFQNMGPMCMISWRFSLKLVLCWVSQIYTLHVHNAQVVPESTVGGRGVWIAHSHRCHLYDNPVA